MPDENEKPGLLHHAHDSVSQNSSPETIERAAGGSHHGIIRDRDRAKLGREQEALLALQNTDIKPTTAWVMTILFLLTITIPPLVQAYVEVKKNVRERAVSTQSTRVSPLPKLFDVYGELPSREKIKSARNWNDAAALLPDAERLKSHETALEDDSIWVQWMLPRAQALLVKAGAGNEQAYIGKNNWLFYRPDVDYLTSPGFLDPALMTTRKRSGDTDSELIQPDPVRAIIDFHNQLQKRGIEFIVMPMPVKPMIEAGQMSSRYNASTPALQNPSYPQFLQSLQAAGVLVFDPTEILRSQKTRTGAPQFLQTDTHWTNEAMQNVALELARIIESKTKVTRGTAGYTRSEKAIENLGDTATMLSLLDFQKLYSKQCIQIQQILDARGELWKRDKDAKVLLLGDSFCNIYSLPAMGWGESAGFAEQLSFELAQPLDSIVINAGGSHTSRARLVGEMKRARKRGRDRLQNVRLVVWEFSMRDLLIGDWTIYPLP